MRFMRRVNRACLFIAFALSFLAPVCVNGADTRHSSGNNDQPITWIFLNTGASREKLKSMPEADVVKMQADHVGNFGTQFNRGTLMAAGPLGDNGFIRGTVVLSVQTPEQIAECFKPDPFVQNDILAVESHPWLVDIMRFGPPAVPFQLARYT